MEVMPSWRICQQLHFSFDHIEPMCMGSMAHGVAVTFTSSTALQRLVQVLQRVLLPRLSRFAVPFVALAAFASNRLLLMHSARFCLLPCCMLPLLLCLGKLCKPNETDSAPPLLQLVCIISKINE